MSKERGPGEQSSIKVTGIYLNLEERSVTFTAHDQVLATLQLAPEGLIFDSSQDRPPLSEAIGQSVEGVARSTTDRGESTETEKPKAVTLQGRLKSKPREGKPDSKGKPTAWARFAAHDPDQDEAHMYSATFHKHTARVALGLEKEDHVTVQGYPHESEDPTGKRMDTLSIINFLDYPGNST